MANITKQKRDEMLAFLEQLKADHNDDASIRAFNEIQNHLTEKKFGLVFEEHTEEVDEKLLTHIPVLCADKDRRLCKDASKPWNFIIQGDNLQALYLLEKTHRGKVDCIYIDPPYNTGAKDWKYNNDYVDGKDVYRHSKWLSMMKNRLVIAKHLLNSQNSVLIVAIDENEYMHLGALLEELFPTSKIQMISVVINPKGRATSYFTRTDEYLFFVFLGDASVNTMLVSEGETEVRWPYLKRSDTDSTRGHRPRQFYPIYINDTTRKIVKIGEPISADIDRFSVEQLEGCTTVFPVNEDGTEMEWGLTGAPLRELNSRGFVRVGKKRANNPMPYSISYLSTEDVKKVDAGELKVIGERDDGTKVVVDETGKSTRMQTVWTSGSYDAGAYGKSILKNMLLGRNFPFPKSLYAVYDTLKHIVGENKEATIVDFFAGSGTTMHAINLLNARDNGNRKCIMVTNNEVSAEEEALLKAKGLQKGDLEWEALGISEYITWPRTVCSINGIDVEGKPLAGFYGCEKESFEKKNDSGHKSCYHKVKTQIYPELASISLATGFLTNVKYFKCDWTPRKPEDYLLSNALCLHIREMIELQNHIEIDNKKYVLILNKSDFNKYVMDPDVYANIDQIWVNQNIVLNSDELKLLRAKGFKYIPREFFGQELREAAE